MKRVTSTHLRWVDEFFRNMKIDYFVSMGPCLSIVRNHSLRGMTFPDNQDLDIYLRKNDEPPDLEARLIEAKWTDRHGHPSLAEEDHDAWNIFAWRWDGEDECSLDIHFLYRYEAYRYTAMMQQYCLYDSYLFDKPRFVEILGLSVPLPDPPEIYLEQEYGLDWRIPMGLHFHKYPSVWRAREYGLHERLPPESRYSKYDAHAVDWVLRHA